MPRLTNLAKLRPTVTAAVVETVLISSALTTTTTTSKGSGAAATLRGSLLIAIARRGDMKLSVLSPPSFPLPFSPCRVRVRGQDEKFANLEIDIAGNIKPPPNPSFTGRDLFPSRLHTRAAPPRLEKDTRRNTFGRNIARRRRRAEGEREGLCDQGSRLKCNKSISVGFIFFPRFPNLSLSLLPYLFLPSFLERRRNTKASFTRGASSGIGAARSPLDAVKYEICGEKVRGEGRSVILSFSFRSEIQRYRLQVDHARRILGGRAEFVSETSLSPPAEEETARGRRVSRRFAREKESDTQPVLRRATGSIRARPSCLHRCYTMYAVCMYAVRLQPLAHNSARNIAQAGRQRGGAAATKFGNFDNFELCPSASRILRRDALGTRRHLGETILCADDNGK